MIEINENASKIKDNIINNMTYDVTTVTYEQLGDTFSMALKYARDIEQPTLILIEVPFGQTI